MDLFHLGGIIKLSIFPLAKALPKSKDEKNEQSKFASRPYLPETVEISTEEDLISAITTNAWSPFVFNGFRHRDNFVSTDFLVLDIDSGLNIEESEKRVSEAGYACLCVVTTSHTPENHRYRLCFPLSRTITSVDDFEASILDLMEAFPESDPSCKDYARFFFGSSTEDGYWLDGELLEPIKAKKEPIKGTFSRPNTESKIKVTEDVKELINELYGEDRDYIPECVDFFLRYSSTGLPGSWTISLNNFVFVLSLQKVNYDVIYDLVEFLSPEELDKRDLATIKRAYEDGERLRDEI